MESEMDFKQRTFMENMEQMKTLLENMSSCVDSMKTSCTPKKGELSKKSQMVMPTSVINELVNLADQEKMDEIRSDLKTKWTLKKVASLFRSFYLMFD